MNELEISRKLKRPELPGGDLQNILVRAGWTPIGSGAEAGLAQHPNKSYVLKIFPTNSMYQQFLDVVDQAPNNPHFPKLNRNSRRIPGTPYSYVRMEKLRPITTYDAVEHFPELGCLLIDFYKKFGITHMAGPWGWPYLNASWDPLTELINCNQVKIDGAAKQAFDLLYEKAKTLGYRRLDMAINNFMARGLTWVITDPFI